MKNIILLAGLAALTAEAVPTVSEVSMSLNGAGNVATVSYRLSDGPAIVTVDIQTNGVPLAADDFGSVKGDWNGRMTDGLHQMTWKPAKKFQELGIKALNAKAVVTAWSPVKGPDYLVCDLTGAEPPRYYADAVHLPGGVGDSAYKTSKLLLKFIPAANVDWYMGTPSNECGIIGWNLGSNTQKVGNYCGESFRRVTLTQSYYLGVYEVTQRQYELVTGNRPSSFSKDAYYATRPVEKIAYSDLRGNTWPGGGRADCGSAAISLFRSRTGLALDLPTEAQWEFACRAGVTLPFNNGTWATSNEGGGTGTEVSVLQVKGLERIARYGGNSGVQQNGNTVTPAADCSTDQGTAAVGSYEPNAFGLYDMHGNVFEWCLDCAGAWLGNEPAVDPVGCTYAQSYASCTHVMRGGSFRHGGRFCRSGARRFQASGGQDAFGFRLCLTLE